MNYKATTTQDLTRELNTVEGQISRIICSVHGFVDKALADHREAIKDELELRTA